jgi:hypothetical protein
MTDKEKRLFEARRTLASISATHLVILESLEKAERAATEAHAAGTVTGECIADRARALYINTLLTAQQCERVVARASAAVAALEAQT